MIALLMVLVLPLLLSEFVELCPALAASIIKMASRRLPANRQARYQQEWLADLSEQPGKLTKLLWAIGTLLSARAVAGALEGGARQAQAVLAEMASNGTEDMLRLIAYGSKENPEHLAHVVLWSTELAIRLGLSSEEVRGVRVGAYVHDVGKSRISDAVLFKRGPLTNVEFEICRTHTVIGADLVAEMKLIPQEARDIVLYHHERFLGDGYPFKLKGTEIPLAARLFTIVDMYDALTRERHYKPAWSHQTAALWMREDSNRQFDPQILHVFLEMIEELQQTEARQKQAEKLRAEIGEEINQVIEDMEPEDDLSE